MVSFVQVLQGELAHFETAGMFVKAATFFVRHFQDQNPRQNKLFLVKTFAIFCHLHVP